jgi:hypothetical protein
MSTVVSVMRKGTVNALSFETSQTCCLGMRCWRYFLGALSISVEYFLNLLVVIMKAVGFCMEDISYQAKNWNYQPKLTERCN